MSLNTPMTVGELKTALTNLPDDAVLCYIETDDDETLSRTIYLRSLVVPAYPHRPEKVRLEIGGTTRDDKWRSLVTAQTALYREAKLLVEQETLKTEVLAPIWTYITSCRFLRIEPSTQGLLEALTKAEFV